MGGDPLKFYELYVREMSRLGAGNGSSEASAAAHAVAAVPPPVAPPLLSVAGGGGGVLGSGGVPSLHHHQQEAEEREAALIVESLRQWRRVGERKMMFSLHLQMTKALSALSAPSARGGQQQQPQQQRMHNRGQGATTRATTTADVPLTSMDILGVDLGEFTARCLHTEKSCLKFLTAMLEGQSPGVVDHVRGSIDSWILFQNMDSLVRSNGLSSSSSTAATSDSTTAAGGGGGLSVQNSEKQRKAERQEAAVLYLTILSTLASLSGVQGGGDYGAKMTKALEEWQEAFANQVRALFRVCACRRCMLLAPTLLSPIANARKNKNRARPAGARARRISTCSCRRWRLWERTGRCRRCASPCRSGSRRSGSTHWCRRPRTSWPTR